MVLEVETDTRKVYKRLNASLAELLWVTDTRSLKDKRRTESSTRDDDLLASLDDSGGKLTRGDWLCRNDFDANSAVAFKDDLTDCQYTV